MRGKVDAPLVPLFGPFYPFLSPLDIVLSRVDMPIQGILGVLLRIPAVTCMNRLPSQPHVLPCMLSTTCTINVIIIRRHPLYDRSR